MKPTITAVLDNTATQTNKSNSNIQDLAKTTLNSASIAAHNNLKPTQSLQHQEIQESDLIPIIESENEQPSSSDIERDKLPIPLILVLPVILGLSLIVFLYYPTSDESIVEPKEMVVQQSSSSIKPEEKLKKLESVANLLVENKNQWQSKEINSFIVLWNSLTKPTRQDLTESVWYKHFVFILASKLKEIDQHNFSKNSLPESSADALFTLALTLDIVRSNQYFSSKRTQQKKFKQLLEKVQSEISKIDSAQFFDVDSMTSSNSLNAALRQEFELTPATKNTSSTQKIAAIKLSAPKPIATITGDKIRELLTTFQTAYKAGDAETMQALFIAPEDTRGSSLVSDLLDSYRSVFNTSISRSISFIDLKWQYTVDGATGTGQYKGKMILANNNGTELTNASVVLKLQLFDQQLKIADIIFRDKNTLSSNPNTLSIVEPVIEEMPFLATSTVPVISVTTKQPNNTELNLLVEQFINAYEAGNIDMLVRLLSENVKSNDKFTLQEIKQDYVTLFSTSSLRNMQIDNIHWKYKNNHAKGSGKLAITITSLDGKSVTNINGKIQIVAKHIDDKLAITHLYHIEHNQ